MDTQPVVDSSPKPPTEFTISGRTYELVPFLKEGESYISGHTMVERAKELNASLGEEDGQFILKHQDEIPVELRGKICLVFTGWSDHSSLNFVAYLYWDGSRWSQYWHWLVSYWDVSFRLVRRNPSTKA